MSKIINIRINENHERAIKFIKNYYQNKYPEFGMLTTSDIFKYALMSYLDIVENQKREEEEKNQVQ